MDEPASHLPTMGDILKMSDSKATKRVSKKEPLSLTLTGPEDAPKLKVLARWALTGEPIGTVVVLSHDYPERLGEVIKQIADIRCSIGLFSDGVPLHKYSTLASAGFTDQLIVDVVQYESDEGHVHHLTRELLNAEWASEIVRTCEGILLFLCNSCGEDALTNRREMTVRSGIARKILGALRANHRSVVVQEAGWAVLSKISFGAHEEIKKMFIQENVVQLLQATIRDHATKKRLKKIAGTTLSNICRGRWSRSA